MSHPHRRFILLLALASLGGIAWHLLTDRPLVAPRSSAIAPAPNESVAALPPAPVAQSAPAPAIAPTTDDEQLEAWTRELPAGRFRDSIGRLPTADRRLVKARLEQLAVPRADYASLVASTGGDLHYVCSFGHTHDAGVRAKSLHEAAAANSPAPGGSSLTVSAADVPSVPISHPPLRHSRPGAPNVLYLDFNGHTITGTNWNITRGVDTYVALPYDTDGDATTFNAFEQADIIEVWRRVAEDFAPFDIDVTTEEPATFHSRTGRALITPRSDANGVAMPASDVAEGVAFLDVFGLPDYSPALVYVNSSAANIAEVVSHELGHNLGLSHDGRTDGFEYYGGHGSDANSWCPIMGTGYGRNVTQWSKGEYYLANNLQDDLAIISAKTGYRADEAGSTPATAAIPTLEAGTFSVAGILANSADIDVYAVGTAAGTIQFSVTAFQADKDTRGNNADLRMELLNSAGTLVASAEAAIGPDAALTYAATAGTYYVRVAPVGTGNPGVYPPAGYTVYGSAGHYTLTGTVVAATPSIINGGTASIGIGTAFNFSINATNSPTAFGAIGLPAGLTIDTATGLVTGRPLEVGVFPVTLSASNGFGSGFAPLTLTVTDAPPVIVEQSSGLQIVAPGGSRTLSASVLSPSGSATFQWRHNGAPIPGATGASLELPAIDHNDSGYYQLVVTNPIGATESTRIFVLVAPSVPRASAWGDAADGGLLPATTLAPVALATGGGHALALRADGSVFAWGGLNSYGERNVPAGLSGVVAIAAGRNHSVALKADGTVAFWGFTGFGTPPANLADVVAISAGQFHSLALKADGTVVAWGYSLFGQTSVPTGLSGVVAIAAGVSHSLALKADGTVVAWGGNNYGESNVPAGLSGVVAIAAGQYHSLALKSDGSVVGWGLSASATPPAGLTNVIAIAAGDNHSLALKTDGTVAAWGDNSYGQSSAQAGLGQGFAIAAGGNRSYLLRDGGGDLAPTISAHPTGQTLAEGSSLVLSVTASAGTAPIRYQWRRNGEPLAGKTAATLVLSNLQLTQAGSYDVVVSSSLGTETSHPAAIVVKALPVITAFSPSRRVLNPGQSLQLSVSATGEGPLRYQWYRDGRLLPGATASAYSPGPATLDLAGVYWVTISDSFGTRRSSPAFVAVAPAASSLRGWGVNEATSIPSGLTDLVAFAGGASHALGLRPDGSVVAWGSNTYGQTTVPAGLANVVAVAAGYVHSLALRSDGTVAAWGYNQYGAANVPAGLSGVIAIAAGQFHSVALKIDGTVVTWGFNDYGQNNVPAGLDNVVSIAAGESHTLALKADGTVVGWGRNDFGQRSAPAGLSGVVAIAGGRLHSLALKDDGTVAGWGLSSYATPPAGLAEVAAIAVGSNHSLALKADGSVIAWGLNDNGQVTPPMGLARAFAISAGARFSLAATVADTSFAAFRAGHFTSGQLADFGVSGAEADPDGDGLPNLLEYAFGLDPLTAEGGLGRPTPGEDEGRLTLTYIRRTDTADLDYVPEVSGDLSDWDSDATAVETISVTPLDAVREQVTVRDRLPLNSSGRRFIRLRVEMTE